ncbi:hypothetical protein [Sphingomonas sp.]|uniref:alpha/beta hydrolase family protein n=1 Tax=Sphingomonas sp. TaxID=28214 RepID=UPI002B95E085|nr:hypothetical protein [Sphingomonas sp.]HWK35334.1 hypothetical protein [Sphingomonas sp.]
MARRMRLSRRRWIVVAVLVILAGVAAAVLARPEPGPPRAPITADQRALAAIAAQAGATDIATNRRPDGGMTLAGKLAGRQFGIAVPADWNGQAVLFAGGYSIPGTPISMASDLIFKDPSGGTLTKAYGEGFAVGQSVFDKSAVAVKSGVENTLRLRGLLQRMGATRFFAIGGSMGGNIVLGLIERHPAAFAGAISACGVTDSWQSEIGKLTDLRATYNYYTAGTRYALPGDKDIAANALDPIPPAGLGAIRTPWVFMQVSRLSSPIAKLFKAARERPDGDEARIVARIASINGVPEDPASFMFPIMTAAVGMDDMRATFGGNVYGNDAKVYASPLLSAADARALNAGIQRIRADAAAQPFANDWHASTGRFAVPLVVVHNRHDSLVFLDQAIALRDKARAAGNMGNLLVLVAPSMVRPIPGTGLDGYAHCGFTPGQAGKIWTIVRDWVETGRKPQAERF